MKLETVKGYYVTGELQEEFTVNEGGWKHGIYLCWRRTGQIWSESKYVNGLRHGTQRSWHDNGQLSNQGEWVNGNKHGTYQEWYKNGQIWEQSEWLDWERNGTTQRWYDNGQIGEQSEWVKGNMHGTQYYWNNDGSYRYITLYDNGKELINVSYILANSRFRKVIKISIYGSTIESTIFLANITTMLRDEGCKYKIVQE